MSRGPAVTPAPLPLPFAPSDDPRTTLPTMYDLPSEDPEEPGLADEFHDYQPQLLRDTFHPPDYLPDRFFVGTDLNLYYTLQHPLWHKRPDWFAVLGASRFYGGRELRLSYVLWQERVLPYVVVELLSPSTADEDLGQTQQMPGAPPTKWMVYEQILGIPYYVTFNRYSDEVHYFVLQGGQYHEIHPPAQRLWLPAAGLGLGLWFGTYEGLERYWLRCYDAQGVWIPTPYEREYQRAELEYQRAELGQQRAELEYQRAELGQQQVAQERQRVEQERQRAERLAAQLRALGIQPEP